MFLVFEGIDGSGKSTQARLLDAVLRDERGLKVLRVREPGGTDLGEQLRRLVLDPGAGELAPETELFIFMAARAHLVNTRIRPALRRGEVVISDRFLWSSVAYQGAGGQIAPREILRLGRLATAGVAVTKTFLIDVKPEVALRRARDRNRMEDRGLEYQRRVRALFLSLAQREAARVAVIDGRGSPAAVHARVLAALPVRGWARCARS
jgi:dTMP kinase